VAWNVGTNKKLWELTAFINRIDPNLKEDVQWKFKGVKQFRMAGLWLHPTWKDLSGHVNTKAITQSDPK
jgi:hypothetical protein